MYDVLKNACLHRSCSVILNFIISLPALCIADFAIVALLLDSRVRCPSSSPFVIKCFCPLTAFATTTRWGYIPSAGGSGLWGGLFYIATGFLSFRVSQQIHKLKNSSNIESVQHTQRSLIASVVLNVASSLMGLSLMVAFAILISRDPDDLIQCSTKNNGLRNDNRSSKCFVCEEDRSTTYAGVFSLFHFDDVGVDYASSSLVSITCTGPSTFRLASNSRNDSNRLFPTNLSRD